MNEQFVISQGTRVLADHLELPVIKNAVLILQRDIARVTTTKQIANAIKLQLDEHTSLKNDAYAVTMCDQTTVTVTAATPRGLMYGVLAISRTVLGIDDFWYFMDTPVNTHASILWPHVKLEQPEYQTQYRGWFVNDELLLSDWQDHASNEYVWQRVYETLLRLGGNLIVPGTDKGSRMHRKQAQEMGLIITHHHAEPLGAEMFARVYPDLEASYLKYPELFKQLWHDSIMAQRKTGVIYALGFRGQGDRPFWLDESDRVWTEADKAKVINDVIAIQYQMVQSLDPGAKCSINVYGELTHLFNEGLLKVPQDVIEIWADSGYGKMVSRRQGDDNPRTPVLTVPNTAGRARGVYYHVTFHDLQASNFLTLLPNSPAFVSNEFQKIRQAHFDTLELINVGNIKPHILFIREVAKSWRKDYTPRTDQTILSEYVAQYYTDHHAEIVSLYQAYFDATIQYGPHPDEKAGDELAPYALRKLIKTWLTGAKRLSEMGWLTGDLELNEQLDRLDHLIGSKALAWRKLWQHVQTRMLALNPQDRSTLYNDLLLGIDVHWHSLEALRLVIAAYHHAQAGDLVTAFIKVYDASCAIDESLQARAANPSVKWRDFYRNDAYTNLALTATRLRRLLSYLRVIGDGPDEDQWERQYLMETSDARVMLLSNTHLALTDIQLAAKLKEQLVDKH